MLVDQPRQNKQVMQVDFCVCLRHLWFPADFADFTFFDSYAAVDDLASFFKVGFSVGEDRINNHCIHVYSVAEDLLNKASSVREQTISLLKHQ